MNWNALAAIATAVAAVAAAAGFLATVRQIKAAARQDRTEWEDELTREYRQIVRHLPLSARLNGQMQDGDIEKFLSIFLDYFDLSNHLGIKGVLQAGPFAAAWSIIKQRNPDLFAELKALEATGFDADPAGWKRLSR